MEINPVNLLISARPQRQTNAHLRPSVSIDAMNKISYYHSFLFYISKLLYVTDILYFPYSFSFSPHRRFVFQTEISGKYIVFALNSLLFYFFSSLRRGEQSTVFLHSIYGNSCWRVTWKALLSSNFFHTNLLNFFRMQIVIKYHSLMPGASNLAVLMFSTRFFHFWHS